MSKDNKHSLIPKISNDYGFQKLKIKVQDVQDLEILSSLCQDGIFAKEEMIYLKENFKFVATFSRFCWEFKKANHFNRNVGFRIVSGLQINSVESIEYINFSDKNEFVNLLSINYDKNFIMLNFSLDMIIKIKIDQLKIFLEDIDLPWPTYKKPIHK